VVSSVPRVGAGIGTGLPERPPFILDRLPPHGVSPCGIPPTRSCALRGGPTVVPGSRLRGRGSVVVLNRRRLAPNLAR